MLRFNLNVILLHNTFTAFASKEGSVVMDFRHPNGRHVAVLLPRRSLAVLTREARYVWTHGMRVRVCISMYYERINV